ncbi:PRC-barrel domain-containing protein [Metabacillus sp. GX 13764]|uniref:PRC-barrel domain-containing protein n=1 Tax=Metabacillus kandeliae TaxID=2900151 RepID=UPI001E3EF97D|nr:PRC-barrel domain-containing protein [Metabacillus kandeliae]MCD7032906.1 PRC-barrel domain-containing protein [Metabacillus kandeliae]
MKKSVEIVGLPIILISEGKEAGKVKSLVLNPDKGTVDFLTVEHEDWQVSVKAIPFKKVIGIGEYAVTIEADNAIIDLNEIPIANQLVNKRISIIDTRIMTRKGQLVGEAKEYFIDEENGNILGILVGMKEKQTVIKSDDVMTYGKDILVVNENVTFLSKEQELVQSAEAEEVKESAAPASEVNTAEEISRMPLDEIRMKQLQLLEGKRVLKDIRGKDGLLVAEKDTFLTEEQISKAQEQGPGTIVELSMNIEM